jgi:glycosyltransferase involved in cell wall biosynthesis
MSRTILFVEPRYHTNQVTLVKKLIERGFDVKYITYESKHSENHSSVKPLIVGYSKLTSFLKKDSNKLKYGIPKLRIFKEIKRINPDIIVVKGFTYSSLLISTILRIWGVKAILNVQKPYHTKPLKLSRRLYYRLFGKYMITPVYGDIDNKHVNINSIMFGQNWNYLPFVAEVKHASKYRKYFKGDKINILLVGKYTNRKMILEFIDLFLKVSRRRDDLSLTIVGTILDEDIYRKAKNFEKESSNITVLKNVKHNDMEKLYLESDLYIMPAINESASCSQLEAMSFGLAVICCDDNGTAHYVKNGINGYIFKKEEYEMSLNKKFNLILESREKLKGMGKSSMELVKEYHSIDQYVKYFNERIKS